MPDRIEPRLSVLPSAQREVWPELRGAATLGFVLYGGTAVALQLAHRQSVDFDFFAPRPLNKNGLLEALPVLASGFTGPPKIVTSTPIAVFYAISLMPYKKLLPHQFNLFGGPTGETGRSDAFICLPCALGAIPLYPRRAGTSGVIHTRSRRAD